MACDTTNQEFLLLRSFGTLTLWNRSVVLQKRLEPGMEFTYTAHLIDFKGTPFLGNFD